MKRTYIHFLRIIIFYLLLFDFSRFLFVLYNHSLEHSFSWGQIFPAFVHGMRMDLSVIAYLLLPSILITGIFVFSPEKWIAKIEYYFHLVLLTIVCLILPVNILIYNYWSTLINFHALTYLNDLSEITTSFNGGQLILIFIFQAFFIAIPVIIFKKKIFKPLQPVYVTALAKLTNGFVIVFITIIMMRGGLQMLPMNESLVSVSENNFTNQAAVNPVWHLANDVYRAGVFTGNPFQYTSDENAEQRVKEMFECKPDSFPHILTTKRPNIVFIMLESFTADIVEAMGGEKGVTPTLNLLIKDGVLFDSIYASGTRTDQGIVSILNGWPTSPFYSIMRSTEKSEKLPSLPKIFLDNGYATSFYYGGESNFSNLNSYCITQKFQSVTDIKKFPKSTARGRWGVHDQFVLERQSNELNTSKQPFFSALMTLSNHEPFDVPGPTRFPGNDEADKFRNAAAYTDAMLGEYFEKVKSLPWYKNTLFIIVADHGHSLPLYRNAYFAACHRIPLIFFGDVIKSEFKGSTVTKVGGQTDIANTLLSQLDLKTDDFVWSKNLLNPTAQSFAYYQIANSFGWVEHGSWFAYSYERKKYIARSFNVSDNLLDSTLEKGKSYVQVLFETYRRY